MAKRRPGRYPEKSAIMNFRITPATKRLLKQAAEASGRTMSAECEFQLQRALSLMGTGRTFALMMMIGGTIDRLVRMRADDADARWWNDPFLFDQAAKAVNSIFGMLRPKGELPQGEDIFEAGGPRKGEFAIEATMREVQLVDPTIPFADQTPHQRWLILLKRELGPLADTAVIWGTTAEQARKEHKLFRKLAPELMRLSRKQSKGAPLKPKEKRRLADLWSEVAAIREGRSDGQETTK